MRTRRFLDAMVGDGIHVFVSAKGVELRGPEDCVKEAREALEMFPSLGDEIIALLNPSADDMRRRLDEQDEDVHAEHRARTARLEAAGIPEAEQHALDTTYRNRNSILPARLKPVTRGGAR